MASLVRKINYIKWTQNDIRNGEEVSADAITGCIKTTENRLSLWRIDEEGEAAIHNAVLAILTNFRELDAIDIVILEESALADAGLKIEATPGDTRVKSLVENHRDIVGLTYQSLGVVARFIVDAFRNEKVLRFSKLDLLKILATAIDNNVLRLQDLKDSVQQAVSRFAVIQTGLG